MIPLLIQNVALDTPYELAHPVIDFRLLFESSPAPYLVLAPDFTIVAVSDAYLRATMTEREAIVGRGLFEVFPDNPADSAATGETNLRASLERVLRLRRPDTMAVQKYDIRRPESEGGGFEERFWSPINSPVLGPSGEVQYIIHRVDDVSDFVRLKRDERAQRAVAEELESRAGQMAAEIIRRGQELQETNQQLRAFHDELEARVEARTAELRKADEALQQSEAQLRQSQKLEAIGSLAGGIAHDFNNLLSVILSYTSLLGSDLPVDAPAQSDLGEITKAAERAATLTRQLLAFSRRQRLELRQLDLNVIVANLHKMLKRVLGEDIELKLLLAPRLAAVRADAGQIEQVVMNLVVNARDAMPGGGRLTIETANVELDQDYAQEHIGVTAGPHVMLAVSDAGVGMDSETQARVFDPFFTTKEPGKGTGLGLSTVFGIVRQCGGHIWLYSELDRGTTFKIYFARSEGPVERSQTIAPAARDLRGTETILLVEDADQVRAVAVGILTRLGYHVLEARSPGEALLVSEKHSVKIHLLLTDVVMAKMNGRELAQRITQARPELKVAFMSGYTGNAVVQHGILDSDAVFLQKPFTPDSLARGVRRALDGGD